MKTLGTLADTLADWAQADPYRQEVAATIVAIADASREVAELVATNPCTAMPVDTSLEEWLRDERQHLVPRANAVLIRALEQAPLAAIAVRHSDEIASGRANARLCAALVPLDGATNVDTNVPGTVFSVLPTIFEGDQPSPSCFLQPGTRQVASGYIVYGPRISLALTVGSGTQIFVLNRRTDTFELTAPQHDIPTRKPNLTVDASNGHRWEGPVRSYVDDWLDEHDGRFDACFQFLRGASFVGSCHRILLGGGIQLYPAHVGERDTIGRTSLVFQANPVAWLTEQAGGAASTGIERILEITPAEIGQETPFVFGARDQVERVELYHSSRYPSASRSPLFVRRGLFLG